MVKRSKGKKIAGTLIGSTVIPILIFIILGMILQLDFVWESWRIILTIGVVIGGFVGWKWIL